MSRDGMVRVVALDHQGRGLAPVGGSEPLLVPGALPGDGIVVEEVVRSGGAPRALRWTLAVPSPDRRRGRSFASGSSRLPCPVAEACGACRLMPLEPEAQRKVKLQRLRRGLSVLPGAADQSVTWVEAPQPLGYRHRLRFRLDQRGRVCLFNQRKTFDCPVLEPSVQELLQALARASLREPAGFAACSHGEIRGRDSDGRSSVLFFRRGSAAPRPGREPPPVGAGTLCAVFGDELPSQRYALTDGVWSLIPLSSFMQINRAVNRLLVDHVQRGAAQRGLGQFVDLYCGAGNLSLPLVAQGMVGRGVEHEAAAVAALRQAVAVQGLAGFTAYQGDAAELARQWVGADQRWELVLANPPRAGLREAVAAVGALSQRYVLLCSCSPESLGRDLVGLVRQGFVLEQVTAFDMFPQTHHLEVAVWLVRPA